MAISAAIEDPTLADIIRPVRTGPSSLVRVRTTIFGIADSAENLENPDLSAFAQLRHGVSRSWFQ